MRIHNPISLHSQLGGVTADSHHDEAHTVVSHSDTTATGAELNTLTDGSEGEALHKHANSVNTLVEVMLYG